MSKKNVDGDVLGNKWSLMAAKSQKILASMMGPDPVQNAPAEGASSAGEHDEDLKVNFGHDRLGVGGYLPKDIADGSFTRRTLTSNDKLLEQLIGKKRAKAHIAAKQEAELAAAREQPQQYHPLGRPAPTKKEESEDEEEGRAATFKSKRRRTDQSGGPSAEKDQTKKDVSNVEEPVSNAEDQEAATQPEENSDDEIPKKAKRARKGRAKPTSYLDELLAERTKKKNKKNQA